MPADTRTRLLAAALEQFAARGFDGVSIASIADEVGLSKQALLHHFSSKERLYGELLADISRSFEARISAREDGEGELGPLIELLLELAGNSRVHRAQTTLLMRELLDNGERARRAGHWYLRPFLEALADRVAALPGWESARRAAILTSVYQILGAINYFAVSGDTLAAMFGKRCHRDMEKAFDDQLAVLIRQTLSAGPAQIAAHTPRARR
jgi:AcrR family transcriptional regulator